MEVETVLGTLDATHKVPRHPGLPQEEHRGFPAPPSVARKLPTRLLAGGAHKSGSSLEGLVVVVRGGGLFQQRGGNSKSLFSPSTPPRTTIKGRPCLPPPPPRLSGRRDGGWERGSPDAVALLSDHPDAAEAGPAHFFFFLLFLFFFPPLVFPFLLQLFSLFAFFFFFSFSFSSQVLPPPHHPPRPSLSQPARPSVGEDQVGDAGLQPVSRDHLAHLGRAVVRELEMRAGAGFEVKIQIPVQRRRRAEAAQGHALKV